MMGYGDGTVFQRSYDGRWIGRLEVDGRKPNGSRNGPQVSAKTEEEAERKLAELRERLSKP
jgi:hypothetical protein